MTSVNLRDCISRCSVEEGETYYYDSRFGIKLMEGELHECYHTRFIYKCKKILAVTHFMRVENTFHLVVRNTDDSMEQCDVLYSSVDHSFTNRTHDPSAVIPAILNNESYKEFFISGEHPYFDPGYIADYKNVASKRPVRSITTLPTLEFYSDLLNESKYDRATVANMGLEPTIACDVDDDLCYEDDDEVKYNINDAWSTMDDIVIDSVTAESNWSDLDYMSDDNNSDTDPEQLDSYDEFNSNGYEDEDEDEDEDEYARQLDKLDELNEPGSPLRRSTLFSRNLLPNRGQYHSTGRGHQIDYSDMLGRTSIGDVNHFNQSARIEAIRRMAQMRSQPQPYIQPVKIELPTDIPKVEERKDNLVDDAYDVDFDLILTNLQGSRLVAVYIRYRNGRVKKEMFCDTCVITTAPRVNRTLVPSEMPELKHPPHHHHNIALARAHARARWMAHHRQPVSTPIPISTSVTPQRPSYSSVREQMMQHSVAKPAPITSRTNNLKYIASRLKELDEELDEELDFR